MAQNIGGIHMPNIWNEKKTRVMLLAIIVLVLAIVFLFTAGTKLLGKSTRIVSADVDRIMGEHPAFKQAMAKFQSEINSMKEKLDKMEGQAKAKEQQQMQLKIQQIAMELQEEAAAKVTEDIQRIAKSKGYDYVLDSKSLVAGGKDITGEILSALKGPEAQATEEETNLLPMIPVK